MAAIAWESWGHSIINPSKVKSISWKPRTDEECNHLISLAKNELKRSAVADRESGESKLSEVRTGSGMFIQKEKGSYRCWHRREDIYVDILTERCSTVKKI